MARDNETLNPSTDANRDPITGTPGAHPVGTGVGATGGALAGAAAGALAGPVGAAVGLVAGAVLGGLGGKAVAEGVNPTAEEAYWRDNYDKTPHYEAGRNYDDYGPAYELGWSGRADSNGRRFEDAEARMETEWDARRGDSTLDWPRAREASRAAWERADKTYYGVGLEGNPRDDFRSDAAVDATAPRAGASAAMAAGGLSGAAMSGATDDLSNDDVVDVLNDLLENSRDGEYGFRACADEVESSQIKQVFASRAEACARASSELEGLVRQYGGTPADGGTAQGALHRGWVHIKGSLGADSELSMLEECERGEDAAVARYRKALKNNLPADVRGVLERQAEGAQRNHDQIRDLRNAARARD